MTAASGGRPTAGVLREGQSCKKQDLTPLYWRRSVTVRFSVAGCPSCTMSGVACCASDREHGRIVRSRIGKPARQVLRDGRARGRREAIVARLHSGELEASGSVNDGTALPMNRGDRSGHTGRHGAATERHERHGRVSDWQTGVTLNDAPSNHRAARRWAIRIARLRRYRPSRMGGCPDPLRCLRITGRSQAQREKGKKCRPHMRSRPRIVNSVISSPG